jgi:hypothetical protein
MPPVRKVYARCNLLPVLRQGSACLFSLWRQDIQKCPVLLGVRSTYFYGSKRRRSCRTHLPGLVATASIASIHRLRLGRWPDSLVASQIQRSSQGYRAALVWHYSDCNRDRRRRSVKSDTALRMSLPYWSLRVIHMFGEAEVAESADATDLKSVGLRPLRVQIPPSAHP